MESNGLVINLSFKVNRSEKLKFVQEYKAFRMSKEFFESSHDKTGIKTSTFYSKKKLEIFPKLIKLQAKSRPIQAVKKCAHDKPFQKPKKNRRKKLPMSHKGGGKKNCKTKTTVSALERFTNCKARDITDLQTGKRPLQTIDREHSEQVTKNKKLKLDLNENIASERKCVPERNICAKEKLETDTCKPHENEIILTLSSDSENSMVETEKNDAEISNLDNTNTKALAVNQKTDSHDAFELDSENDIFGSPLSSCQSDESIKETVQNIAKSNSGSSPNVNGNDLTTDQRMSSCTVDKSEIDIFGSPISLCENGSKNIENDKQLNSSLNIKNTSLGTVHCESPSATNEAENDIFGTLFLPCKNTSSSKQSKKKTKSPCKKMGSLDSFILKERTQMSKSNKKLRDSAFHEPFRILGELSSQEDSNCLSTETSPLLFSQSSTSSGCSSKTKSTSPESQSSITKYFTPLRKNDSGTVLKNNVSPGSDKGKRLMKGRTVTSPSSSPLSNKKEQMFLDLGQKNFGHITCPTCNMVYTSAQPEDEAYHIKFHHKVISALRFKGWKTERVVEHFDDGRVIVVLPQDLQSHLKKVDSVRTVVDDELGFSSETSLRMQDSKTYLFIADKKVVGCVVAVVIQEAFPLLPCPTSGDKVESSEPGAWCCSSAPVRAQCGISRVWVLQQYRRKKIATRILDCVRNDFMFGGVVSKDLLAFSDPTPLGKQLAESYCGTENFLVFR